METVTAWAQSPDFECSTRSNVLEEPETKVRLLEGSRRHAMEARQGLYHTRDKRHSHGIQRVFLTEIGRELSR
jgi:hypothetical protein